MKKGEARHSTVDSKIRSSPPFIVTPLPLHQAAILSTQDDVKKKGAEGH